MDGPHVETGRIREASGPVDKSKQTDAQLQSSSAQFDCTGSTLDRYQPVLELVLWYAGR